MWRISCLFGDVVVTRQSSFNGSICALSLQGLLIFCYASRRAFRIRFKFVVLLSVVDGDGDGSHQMKRVSHRKAVCLSVVTVGCGRA